MKEEKGVTMVILTITIIVVIILVGVSVYVGADIIERAKLQSLSTDMLLIQAKVKTIGEKADFENNNELLVGATPSQEILTKLGLIASDKIRILSKENLKNMGLQKVEENNSFVVDYDDSEIYYTEGYEDKNGNVYYCLSEINKIAVDE